MYGDRRACRYQIDDLRDSVVSGESISGMSAFFNPCGRYEGLVGLNSAVPTLCLLYDATVASCRMVAISRHFCPLHDNGSDSIG